MTLDEAIALRKAGHAVSVAVIWNAEGKRESFFITHYLTCAECEHERIARSTVAKENGA